MGVSLCWTGDGEDDSTTIKEELFVDFPALKVAGFWILSIATTIML